MKKLAIVAVVGAVALNVLAQTAETAESAVQTPAENRVESTVWPAFFAAGEYPAAPDLVGIRLTIPYSTKQENVTGIDIGFWGRSLYFQGLQFNVLRNDVKDSASAFQVGLYNSISSGDMLGIQVGLFNEANSVRGLQAGLVNITGEAQGFQVGVFNRAETMYGFQVGLINVIRDAEIQFLPVVNIGF